jgi:OOP family OmpA-OmpF porin
MRTRIVVILSVLVVALITAGLGFIGYRMATTVQQASLPVSMPAASSSPTASAEATLAAASSPGESPAPAESASAGATPVGGETPTPEPSESPSPSPSPTIPAEPTGLPVSWTLQAERVVGGPEADLVVRTGDINNLGYGWPLHFTPFSGISTPPHPYPCQPRPGAAAGTDRIMLGTGVTDNDLKTKSGDGYSSSNCSKRPDNLPQAIPIEIGALPPTVHNVFFQIFADDFQPKVWHSRFQVTLNGTRIPSFEDTINQLDQTGPIGKLLTLRLLPEYYPLLRSGSVNLLFDDPTTGVLDAYAVDFVRVLVNHHGFRYTVIIHCNVVDAATGKPIKGASVSAADVSATTGGAGNASLRGVPAGLVSVGAGAVGYDSDVQLVDLPAGQVGTANFQLKAHKESGVEDLKRSIALNGSAAIYGIHFDTASAKLRPDSVASLQTVLQLIETSPGSRWTISGHTDNQGGADYNLGLSDARAKSVVTWLIQHGIEANRLVAKGYGLSRPVADNGTDSGRALNRRVEVAPLK